MDEIKDVALESCINTLQQLGVQMKKTKVSTLSGEVVQVQIEFIGDVKGYVIIETTPNFACKLANIMLSGMTTVTDIDDMCKSVLQELTNMISGGISTCLDAKLGFKTDIKPPSIDIRPKALDSKFANSLQFVTNDGFINMYIIIK